MGAWEQPGGRRPVPLVAVALLAVVVVGWLAGMVLERGSEDGLTVEAGPVPVGPEPAPDVAPSPESVVTPTPTPPLVTIGEWRALPAAPAEIGAAPAGAWTGAELVVFGGGGDIAAFDPEVRAWRTVPPPPGALPESVAPVWAGEEVLIWAAGGAATDMVLDSGLAYRPSDDRWREVAAPPGGAFDAAVAVWTGAEVVAIGPQGGLAYDPETDAWRRIADPGRSAVARAAGLWTGEEVVVWGGRNRDEAALRHELPAFAQAYDPREDSWRRLPRPLISDSASAPAVWTGHEVVMWGRPVAGAGEASPPTGATLDPSDGRWRLMPRAPGSRRAGFATQVYGHTAVWTGEQVLVHGGSPEAVGLAYDPDGREWALLPRRPGLVHHVAAWTGDAMLVWGGYGLQGPTADLVEWRPVGLGRPPARVLPREPR